jgi:hypothetical protein
MQAQVRKDISRIPWFLFLRDMSSQGIQAEVDTKQIYAFSQLCPAKDEDCKLYPPNQKGRRRGDWKRLAKSFGSKDP